MHVEERELTGRCWSQAFLRFRQVKHPSLDLVCFGFSALAMLSSTESLRPGDMTAARRK